MGRESDEKKAKTARKYNELFEIYVNKFLDFQNVKTWVQQPEDYAGELYVLSNMLSKEAILKGHLAAIATLALLRRRQIGNVIKKIVRRNHYQLDPPPSAKPKSFLRRMTRFGFDVTFSAFVGLGVISWTQDDLLLASSVASMPLVPGRSVFADQLCLDIQKQARQLQHDDHGIDPTVVAAISSFARNCKLRQDYEDKLRQQAQGLDENAPVKIPPPGVPMDYTMKENAYQHGNDDAATSNKSDEDWAKSFVTDQEDSGSGDAN